MPESNGTFTDIKQIEAGVLSVGYAEAGPANGRVVILLHGWPYDIDSYAKVSELLVAMGYRVIVPYLLLLLLDNIFSKEWDFFNAKVGPGMLLICLLFGFEHGLMVNYEFKFAFGAFNFFRTFFVSALAFTWLKEKSGNLIFPNIAHFGTEKILAIVIADFF